MNDDNDQAFEQARILAEEAVNCSSAEELCDWTIEHRESINETFFCVLDQSVVIDPEYVWVVRDPGEVADFVRNMLDSYHQEELLQSVLQAATSFDRRATLEAIIPEITRNFFHLLGRWVDEASRDDENSRNEKGMTICDELLGLKAFNDLLEDWDEPSRTIIWGSAWFAYRHDSFFRSLVDLPHSDQPLRYEVLEEFIKQAVLIQGSTGIRISLAVLNVILEASSRAVGGPSMASRTDELRFMTFAKGAKLIALRSRVKARRVFDEAQSLLDRFKSKPMNPEESIAMGIVTAAFRNEMGEMIAHDHPDEAVQLHRQALQYYEELMQQAQAKQVAGDYLPRAKEGRAHSLSRLAEAEIMTWQLDEAANHLEQAIALFREFEVAEPVLAEYILVQAQIAFLRTDFSLAEDLLAEATSLQREEAV